MVQNLGGPIYQTSPVYNSTGGNGVVPPFFFSRGGSNPVGTYLKTGDVITSETGQIIVGSNTAVKIVVSNYNLLSNTTRIQFVERTTRTTWSEITALYIDIPSGNYKYQLEGLSIALPENVELGCYIKSGSNMNDTIVGLFAIPG